MGKRICSLIFFLSLLLLDRVATAQNVGMGTGTPDTSAVLDINSNVHGLLIPRMTTTGIHAISNPAKRLLAYDSTKSQLMINRGTPAFPDWQTIVFNGGWNLTGNSGTDPSVNFIGTKDSRPLRFGVNSVPSGQIDSTYNLSFFGYGAGKNNTSGYGNSGMGYKSLSGNTTGKFNTAMGDSALSNTVGDNNTALGYQVLTAPNGSFTNQNTGVGWNALADVTGTSNTAFGIRALSSAKDRAANTAAGYASMAEALCYSNTAIGSYSLVGSTGADNVAIGYGGLKSNTTGGMNTAIGYNTLTATTDKSNMVAIGSGVLSNNPGNLNTATGARALSQSNGGSSNTASGYAALIGAAGGDNTATGAEAMRLLTIGDNNTAIGRQAFYNGSQSEGNTAAGVQALYSNTVGNNNTALGYYALRNTTTTSGNTAAGEQALYFSLGGANTAIGCNSLYNTSDRYYNTAVGYNSGAAYIPGDINTMVGANCNISTPGLYNCVAIGQDVTCTASNQVRIGNAATYSIGGYADWSTISDGRFKKEIREQVKGLDFVMMLRPVTYHLDATAINDHLSAGRTRPANEPALRIMAQKESRHYSGFVAQDVEKVARKLNYAFSGIETPSNANSVYGLRYDEFVAPLIKAMQQQQQQIILLQQQNEELIRISKEEDALHRQIVEKLRQREQTIGSTKN